MSGVYVDGLILDVVRPVVAPVQVGSLQPADLLSRLPYVVVKHIGGPGTVDTRFRPARVLVQVDAYHGQKRAAFDLATEVLDALVTAWRQGTTYPNGRIAGARDFPVPTELRLPDQASGFTRYTATCPITVA